jgi:hypothetical protein
MRPRSRNDFLMRGITVLAILGMALCARGESDAPFYFAGHLRREELLGRLRRDGAQPFLVKAIVAEAAPSFAIFRKVDRDAAEGCEIFTVVPPNLASFGHSRDVLPSPTSFPSLVSPTPRRDACINLPLRDEGRTLPRQRLAGSGLKTLASGASRPHLSKIAKGGATSVNMGARNLV